MIKSLSPLCRSVAPLTAVVAGYKARRPSTPMDTEPQEQAAPSRLPGYILFALEASQ